MIKFNYYCINCTCGANVKARDFSIVKDKSEKEVCPNNEKLELKLMGESSYGGIGTFNGLSNQGKAKMLAKRSLEDAKKRHNPNDIKGTKI